MFWAWYVVKPIYSFFSYLHLEHHSRVVHLWFKTFIRPINKFRNFVHPQTSSSCRHLHPGQKPVTGIHTVTYRLHTKGNACCKQSWLVLSSESLWFTSDTIWKTLASTNQHLHLNRLVLPILRMSDVFTYYRLNSDHRCVKGILIVYTFFDHSICKT